MNKSAFDSMHGYSPAELFLISALGGAGGFGGMRLLTDALGKTNPQKPKENTVRLALANPAGAKKEEFEEQSGPAGDMQPTHGSFPGTTVPPSMSLPEQQQQGYKQANDGGLQYNSDPGALKFLAGMAGAPVGFLGAKFLYDKFRENQMKKQIGQAQDQYSQALMDAQAQQKMGSATPCVDSFCEAIAGEMNKMANEYAIPYEAASDIAGSPLMTGAMDDIHRSHLFGGIRNMANQASGQSGDFAKQTAIVLGALGAGGILGSGIYANNKRREKEEKAQYPNKVVYA